MDRLRERFLERWMRVLDKMVGEDKQTEFEKDDLSTTEVSKPFESRYSTLLCIDAPQP